MIRVFLREIRVEHTLFALPFAYTGAVIGAHGRPTWMQLVWITVAVLGARTAAMAANRLFDRDIDARNPRTAQRATATGELHPRVMIAAIIVGLLVTLGAAYLLNPLCAMLMPIAAVGILLYPLCKRFTWLTHFVLGAVDGLAPLGAAIAVSGAVTLPGLLLFVAVTFWVAGFDILYALMDFDVDRSQGIFSLPARFGPTAARILPLLLHAAMTIALLEAGSAAGANRTYALGLLAAGALIAYERRIITSHDNVFVLNDHIFKANMVFSVVFLMISVLSFVTPV